MVTIATHLIIPDAHAHYLHDNERATLLSRLVSDIKPDVVINMGDGADMPSLCSYDKGRKSFIGRTYRQDINSHLDFQDRLWSPIRARKKRLPFTVYLIGNHDQRINKAIDLQPELEGVIGLDDLELNEWYDKVIYYEGSSPGTIAIDGVVYSHYFISGVMGRPIGGEHPATSLLTKQYQSCTAGHLHLADWSVRTNAQGQKIMGCICGVFQDYDSDYAGEANKLWWRGVVVKHNVENGCYDPEWISLQRLKREYGGDGS